MNRCAAATTFVVAVTYLLLTRSHKQKILFISKINKLTADLPNLHTSSLSDGAHYIRKNLTWKCKFIYTGKFFFTTYRYGPFQPHKGL